MKKLLLILAAIAIAMPNAVEAKKGGWWSSVTHAASRQVKTKAKKVGKAIVKDQAKKMVAESKGQHYETRLEKFNRYHPEYVNKGRPGKFKDYVKQQERKNKRKK